MVSSCKAKKGTSDHWEELENRTEGVRQKEAKDLNSEMEPLNQGNAEEDGDQKKEPGSTNSRPWWKSPLPEEKAADGLDWDQLEEEFKNLFKFNAENRSWWTIVKTSLVIFAIRLAPSLLDMGTDAFSVYD